MKRPVAYIAGTGRGVPAHVMSNHDFAAIGIETSHEWIVERSGIHTRHIAKTETACSMGADAARKAMTAAGVEAGEIDVIVLATATPDRLLPSTAVDLQAELGAARAAAFDVSAACSGWLYAMTVAEGMMMSGVGETILVVAAEKMSAITDWTDRSTCVLFGDGAGAVVLKRSQGKQAGHGILSAYMRSDGTLAELLYRPKGGATDPFSPEVLAERSHYVKMSGREVFKHAVRSMADAADRALDGAKMTGTDSRRTRTASSRLIVPRTLISKSSRGSSRLVVTATCAAKWKTAFAPAAAHTSSSSSRTSPAICAMRPPWRCFSQARLRSTPGRDSAS